MPLFCMTGNYTAKALAAMGKSNNGTSRREVISNVLEQAGGRVVEMYYTSHDGPGVMLIFEAEPAVARAVTGIGKANEAVENIKFTRLFSQEEVMATREARRQMEPNYIPPGQ